MLLLVFMLWLVAPTVAAAGEGAEPGVVSPLSFSSQEDVFHLVPLLNYWFWYWFCSPGLSFGCSFSSSPTSED